MRTRGSPSVRGTEPAKPDRQPHLCLNARMAEQQMPDHRAFRSAIAALPGSGSFLVSSGGAGGNPVTLRISPSSRVSRSRRASASASSCSRCRVRRRLASARVRQLDRDGLSGHGPAAWGTRSATAQRRLKCLRLPPPATPSAKGCGPIGLKYNRRPSAFFNNVAPHDFRRTTHGTRPPSGAAIQCR